MLTDLHHRVMPGPLDKYTYRGCLKGVLRRALFNGLHTLFATLHKHPINKIGRECS